MYLWVSIGLPAIRKRAKPKLLKGFALAQHSETGVKPRLSMGKNGGFLTGYAHRERNREFDGRNGDRSMTNGANISIAKGEVFAGNRAPSRKQPRPSLGSSHALLLLSCP
jgi:hypothetical protein